MDGRRRRPVFRDQAAGDTDARTRFTGDRLVDRLDAPRGERWTPSSESLDLLASSSIRDSTTGESE